MLIRFDLSGLELKQLQPDLLELRISMLLRVHQQGKHLFVLSRRSIEAINQMKLNFIASDAAVLRRLSQNVTQNGLLHTHAKKYISIVASGGINKSDNAISLPLNHNDFEKIIEPSLLISEDAVTDGNVIKAIINSSSGKSSWKFAHFESLHGGGTRTKDIIMTSINNRRVVLGIKDSDKKTPFCQDIPDQALDAALQNWPLATLLIWPCHELENIFTIDVLQEMKTNDNANCLSHLIEMEKLDVEKGIEERLKYKYFFDVKEGLSTTSLKKITNEDSRKWLLAYLNNANIDHDNLNIVGFGKNISDQILKTGKALSVFHGIVRTDKWLSVFGSLISEISWVVAASPVERT